MMGATDPQRKLFHAVQLEDFVPEDHPLRKIRPLVDAVRIRALCRDLYCPNNGRPSIPPEQLFLALLGGYFLGVRSDRKLILELQCNMAFRWFVGLDMDSPVWDPSTFSKNREHRFDQSDVLDRLFDDTVQVAMEHGWVSTHWSVDGTLVRANASHKSFVPIEVYQSPQQYRTTIAGRPKDRDGGEGDPPDPGTPQEAGPSEPPDPGNPSVDWRGHRRSNQTHRSTTDPDARWAKKSTQEGAVPAYTVNGVMENRHRVLVGIGVERCQGPTAEHVGALGLFDRIRQRLGLQPTTVGADKGYFAQAFLEALDTRRVEPHVAVKAAGRAPAHTRVREHQQDAGYQASQRARKKIEELWGEAKDQHGLRRFWRRTLDNVRQEALMIGWLLNLKRLAKLVGAPAG